jgi:2-polyprenyl-3-methyl-5-hydroxy-6-metoxy-1,4-benzoquinol methylase
MIPLRDSFIRIRVNAHTVPDWTVNRGGHAVFRDTADHVSLVVRTLRIDEPTWRRAVETYADRWSPAAATVADRLGVLRDAYASAVGPAGLPADVPTPACPVCEQATVAPAYARALDPPSAHEQPDGAGGSTMVYGRCPTCGHGLLLAGAAADGIYNSPTYYSVQGVDGVGYAAYAAERDYRESKGDRLLQWIAARVGTRPRRMLEVGSGFGYTRSAAERLGITTLGVDLNPCAVEAAAGLYGIPTVHGTLRSALASGDVAPGAWDLVLYNFVLEHVHDPAAELRDAAAALAPDGCLALVVPSMDACEVDVFGGTYRSFRRDHPHIFSRRSLATLLARAGLSPLTVETECNAHLLRGFLTDAELRALYERGGGPDMIVLATLEGSCASRSQ